MKKFYSLINKKRLFDEKKIFVQAKKSQEEKKTKLNFGYIFSRRDKKRSDFPQKI